MCALPIRRKAFFTPVDPTFLSGSRVMAGHGIGGRHTPSASHSTMLLTKQAARKNGLAARRQLSLRERHALSRRICCRIIRFIRLRNIQTISAYVAMPDEVDLSSLIAWCLQNDKNILVPSIGSMHKMAFKPIEKGTRWRTASYGIKEPFITKRFASNTNFGKPIELICAPLSAFDAHFNRTGMGGGFYDRFINSASFGPKSHFLGVAFTCQQSPMFATESHDIALDKIVTEKYIHQRSKTR